MKLIDIITNKKIILPIFLIGLVLSLIAVSEVKTNYDMTKYLPEDSLSTTDLDTIENNTSDISTISVMVKVNNDDEIEVIEETLSKLQGVSLVIIDSKEESNYKDGYALYTLIIENNNTEKTKQISERINSVLDTKEHYLGGESIKALNLEKSITAELPIILIFGFSIVFVILFITTKTYLEPISIILVIGVSIIINLGSNIIFEDISYITKSTAAILQLGLSMDYTIIILHSYYKHKQTEKSKNQAMKNAIQDSYRTVLSSSFTTVIGLLALMFMSFTIGTDLGLVLAKGIIFSLITSFTLLPVVLVLVDKIPFNKSHKMLGSKGFSFHFHKKTHNIILSLFVLGLVLAAFFIQNQNTYLFTEPTKYDEIEKINSVFDETNTFVLAYDRSDNDLETEELIISRLNQNYKNQIISYIGKTSSYKRDMNITSIQEVLDEEEGKLLLGYYYSAHNDMSITYEDFAGTLEELLQDYPEYSTDETSTLVYINNHKETNYSHSDLYQTLISSNVINENSDLEHLIKTNYDLQSIKVHNVNTTIKLYEYLFSLHSVLTQTGTTLPNIDLPSVISQIETLKAIETSLQTETNPEGFVHFMTTSLGSNLDISTATSLYTQYNTFNSLPVGTQQTPDTMIQFMTSNGLLTPEQQTIVTEMKQSIQLINTDIDENSVNQTLENMLFTLTTTSFEVKTSNNMNLIVISNVLNQKKLIPQINQSMSDSIIGLKRLINTTPELTSSGNITEDNLNQLEELVSQIQLLSSSTTHTISELETLIGLNEQAVLIYGYYAKDHSISDFHVTAEDLLQYIDNQSAYNLNQEQKHMLDKYLNQIEVSKELTTSESLNVIILNTSIPLEGTETKEFINYIREDVYKNLTVDTYLAGTSVSNMEISDYFEEDLLKINFITIGAIFLIIAVTFKSLLIPFLLVLTIEGAIWTNLSTSSLLDNPILFIVYIIIGAIQLGATIDYAILLTNSYLIHRKDSNVSNAMTKALTESSSTILTSGIMLIVAGFTIFFASSQSSIYTVGIYIGIGTIISILYVLFLLPAILMSFDKFIVKKNSKNRKYDN